MIYRIITVTSTQWNAETNANIFIQLHGSIYQSEKSELSQSDNSIPFQKGQTDIFELRMNNVGNLNNLTINLDGSNSDDGWYLEYIVVHDTIENKSWKCECYKWLDKSYNTESRNIPCKKGIELMR